MHASRAPKNRMVYAEGKTKLIWLYFLGMLWGLVYNKPFVTAGDGKYCEYIPGKDKYVTAAACNIFRLLNARKVRTHYKKKIDEYSYLVRLLTMMPIEIVVRFIAFGSYLERNPHVEEGRKFAYPVVEFFYKNDEMHDPMMIWDPTRKHFRLYNPHKPLNDSHESLEMCDAYIGELNPANDPRLPQNQEDIYRIVGLAKQVAFVLQEAFHTVDGTLVDFKFECGRDKTGAVYVGDQIDADSCRIWMYGDKNKAVDKDRYRRLTKQGKALLESKERLQIADDYRRFAEMTELFSTML